MYAKQASTLMVVIQVGGKRANSLAQVPSSECQAFLKALNARATGGKRYWADTARAGEANPGRFYHTFAEFESWVVAQHAPAYVGVRYVTAEQAAWEKGATERLAVLESAPLPVTYTGAAAAALARIAKAKRVRKAKA